MAKRSNKVREWKTTDHTPEPWYIKLREYEVEEVEVILPGEKKPVVMLEGTCPRNDCNSQFLVDEEWEDMEAEYHGAHYPTRPCPYCFRVSLLPGMSINPKGSRRHTARS